MGDLKYKVGDKVRIKSLDWYNENRDPKHGFVFFGNGICFYSHMSKYCGKTMTISEIVDCCYVMAECVYDNCNWTDKMIEELVEEATEPELKFKVGDKVITDTNMKGKIIEVVEEGWYRVEFEPYNGIPQPNGVVPEESISLVEEETLIKLTGEAIKNNEMVVSIDEWILPEGYIFKDENGNVINATKIVLEKKKKEYPKTYEECCYVLGFENTELVFEDDYRNINPPKEQWKRLGLMNQLNKLLICRDAYWKIAGEEMGLSGSWKPDFASCTIKYAITYYNNVVSRYSEVDYNSTILVFPTEEMRDAFYEAFKDDIEYCKELL